MVVSCRGREGVHPEGLVCLRDGERDLRSDSSCSSGCAPDSAAASDSSVFVVSMSIRRCRRSLSTLALSTTSTSGISSETCPGDSRTVVPLDSGTRTGPEIVRLLILTAISVLLAHGPSGVAPRMAAKCDQSGAVCAGRAYARLNEVLDRHSHLESPAKRIRGRQRTADLDESSTARRSCAASRAPRTLAQGRISYIHVSRPSGRTPRTTASIRAIWARNSSSQGSSTPAITTSWGGGLRLPPNPPTLPAAC